ncbi:tRNA-uridine aminocarboxypropyltransferase [Vibrio sp. RC27]
MTLNSFQRLHQSRIENSTKPFQARGGRTKRCSVCQTAKPYCICHARPRTSDRVAVLLLLSDNEVLKPSNTGRLVADIVTDTHAFQWNRTEPDPNLLALLSDPKYFPVILFPQEYIEDSRRILSADALVPSDKTLLLILLDGSWREARRMFRKSPYLNALPVISITPTHLSQYLLRKSENENHLSTAEVTALALKNVGLNPESDALIHWFEAFREAYQLSKSRGEGDQGRSALTKLINFNETLDNT